MTKMEKSKGGDGFDRAPLIEWMERLCPGTKLFGELWSATGKLDPQDAQTIIRGAILQARLLDAATVKESTPIVLSSHPVRIKSEDVMERLGCHVDYLIDLKHIGALSCVKVARRDKYDVDQVEEFIRKMANPAFRHGVNKRLKVFRDKRDAEREAKRQKKRAG